VTFTQEALDSGDIDYNYSRRSFPSTEASGLSVFARLSDGDGGPSMASGLG